MVTLVNSSLLSYLQQVWEKRFNTYRHLFSFQYFFNHNCFPSSPKLFVLRGEMIHIKWEMVEWSNIKALANKWYGDYFAFLIFCTLCIIKLFKLSFTAPTTKHAFQADKYCRSSGACRLSSWGRGIGEGNIMRSAFARCIMLAGIHNLPSSAQ